MIVPAGLDKRDIGDLGEETTDFIYKRADFEKVDSKYADDIESIDNLFIRRSNGEIVEVHVVETKYRTVGAGTEYRKKNFRSYLEKTKTKTKAGDGRCLDSCELARKD